MSISVVRSLTKTVLLMIVVLPHTCFAGDAEDIDNVNHRMPVVQIRDVELGAGGVLTGAVVTSEAAPMRQTKVLILHQGQLIAATATDENGYFVVRGLRGGVYSIEAAPAAGLFRVWAAGTAPPSAQQGIQLVVPNAEIIRAQGYPPQPPVWKETQIICKEHIHGMIWGGLLTGFTYWSLDYNKSNPPAS